MSGADLEYRAMLAKAGIDPLNAQGYDAARLEQLQDARELTHRSWSQSELDALYKNVGELVTNLELPSRLRDVVGSYGVPSSDWNAANASGLYTGLDCANAPGSGWWMVRVEAHNSTYIVQTAVPFASGGTPSATDSKMYRRDMNNGVWSSWYRIRWHEEELDSRYKWNPDASTAIDAASAGKFAKLATIVIDNTNSEARLRYSVIGFANASGALFADLSVTIRTAGALPGDPTLALMQITVSDPSNLLVGQLRLVHTVKGATSNTFEIWIAQTINFVKWSFYEQARSNSAGSITYVTNALYVASIPAAAGLTYTAVNVQPGGDSGWIAPTLQNSWVNYGNGFHSAGYRKIGNRVFLRGVVAGGVVGATTPVFTLPAGYRPPNHCILPAVTSNYVAAAVRIDTTGVVGYGSATGSATWASLDGISFSVD